MDEKTFINGLFIREKEFDNGGSVLNCSFKLEDIQEIVDEILMEDF